MKPRLTSIALAALLCVSCFPTRIVTVSEPTSRFPSYSTVVTVPKTHVTTTTTQVYATEPDISLYLDLQAVAAAFAQSSSIREFEALLNNSSYIISDLDLNRDGYVDYLRVVSAMQGYNHVFVIQAALAPNVYQDVATVVAEVPSYGNYHVEVIGSTYIYGPNYVIRPVYYTRPVIFDHICGRDYRPWTSPWYWNHYPSYYKRPALVHVNHYHAYVNTFMKNHKYCHEVHYYSSCHYPQYQKIYNTLSRDDYSRRYPERSFTVRNANVAVNNSAVTRAENARTQANAYDVRMAYDATKTTTTSSTRSSGSSTSATRGTAATGGSSATRGTSASSGTSATRGTSTTTGSSATRGSGTSSSSTGSASRGTSTSGTTSGSSTRGTTSSGTGTSRSSASTSTSTGRTTGTSATRSTSSSSTATRGSSTTSSRVQSSGSSSTKTSTTTASGQQSTVRRGSSSSTATRSSSGSSATRSSGSTSTTTRSTGSSATRTTGTTSTTRR
ncbi:MAG: hypothetical protein ACI3ZM_09025 [Candidatus Cryptobacteroides sp.]